MYYNGTENDWSKVLISTSASGNDKLINATFHFLKTDAPFSDTEGKVAEAALYLTGRGYVGRDRRGLRRCRHCRPDDRGGSPVPEGG